MALDDAAKKRIAPYVSSLENDVFALSGLPEEVIAVLFAYYSRSREGLRENLAKLLADDELDVEGEGTAHARQMGFASDKARAFHEKWVVGYGHASVAEHAVVHLAIENASIVASKVIEDLRLGSYTEKSTRYVVFDRGSLASLPDLPKEARERYEAAGGALLDAYRALIPRAQEALKARLPKPEGASEAAHAAAIRAQACDLLRGLLPAGTKTNLGLTANARALEILLSKMFSSPLEEVRRLATKMLKASMHVAPTLVKYAAPNPHRQNLQADVAAPLAALYAPRAADAGQTVVLGQPVRLVRHDADALERVVMALAFEGSEAGLDCAGLAEAFRGAPRGSLEAVVRAALARRGPHDPAPRALEASTMTVELLLDYGAYRDLQRHRMLTPATQRLTCRLGYEPPPELAELGLLGEYEDAMRLALEAWQSLEPSHPLEAQYVIPLAFRVRTLWTLNLRELFHVCELRSAKQGHASYRKVAQALYRAASAAHPWLKDLVRVDLADYPLARA